MTRSNSWFKLVRSLLRPESKLPAPFGDCAIVRARPAQQHSHFLLSLVVCRSVVATEITPTNYVCGDGAVSDLSEISPTEITHRMWQLSVQRRQGVRTSNVITLAKPSRGASVIENGLV